MDENVKEVRTHRVGSITLGSTLVLFGILFLLPQGIFSYHEPDKFLLL